MSSLASARSQSPSTLPGTLSSELSPAGAAPRLDVVVSETESDSSSSARQGRLRWARSTTERSPVVPNLQQSWTPIKPVVDQHPKAASPLLLSSFGRKLARESPIHRKAATIEEVKPSNIRKRNFGATFADAVDKENAEKIADINDLPATINKSQGFKPFVGGSEASHNEKSDNIKGDRSRGAFTRGSLVRENDSKDWERLRVNVKARPKPDSSTIGSAIGSGAANSTEPRRRIKLKGSFLGLIHSSKGFTTPRTPRTDDELPQRAETKRERIRNLRIRRPFISSQDFSKTTPATTTTVRPLTTTTSTTTSPLVTSSLTTSTEFAITENIINLRGIVKEYKEIVRTSSTAAPVSTSSKDTYSVKTEDELLTLNDAKTISTTVTVASSSSAVTDSTKSTASTEAAQDLTTINIVAKSLSKNHETLPNLDSSENVISSASETETELDTAASASASKSLKPSIQSAVPSTTASLTVTESKELPGSSDIKQSKTHIQQPSPSSLQIDPATTRNPIEIQRPREALQKDLLEAIRRKISRNKAGANTATQINQTENEGRNLISSTKSPLFRPLSFVGSKKNVTNSSDPRVKIFINLPEKYQDSPSVKIPNISHIRNKLERLNDAITEGLKLDRLREKKEEKERRKTEVEASSQKSVVKSHSSSVQIVSHSSNDAGNQETIRKQLFGAPGRTGTDIKYQFGQVTATTARTSTSTSRRITSTTPTTIASTTTKSTTVENKDNSKSATEPPKSKRKKQNLAEHPSSHFRPNNWTTSDFIPMPKSNLPPKEDVRVFVVTPKYTPVIEKNNEGGNNKTISTDTAQPSVSTASADDITSTAIYVIGVIAVIPVAGLVAWTVRTVLRRKGLAGSESSSETGLNRPITEDDSLQISGRGGAMSFGTHCFDPIAEAPENIPKVLDHGSGSAATDMLGSVWEFPRSRLRLQTVLGEGNFGKVWKAEADEICGYDGTILVAVKTVKENSAQKEVDDLIQEMKIMQEIGSHPNVVTILGVCTEQEPYLLVMEYVMYGKLLTHLREHRMKQSSFFNFSKDGGEVGETLTSKDLTKFAYGVAKGMEYLVSKGIIHRDLAARNILVDHNKNTKISDFGLSRSLRDLGSEMYEQKTKGALPIRWMAPESLYFSVFTPKSDVWGFGILMWEIVTLGKKTSKTFNMSASPLITIPNVRIHSVSWNGREGSNEEGT